MLLESDAARLKLEETELTLALPGGSRTEIETAEICSTRCSGSKRAFSETVDLSLGSSLISTDSIDRLKNSPESQISVVGKLPPSKAPVVGWPPVRSFRTNALKSCKYVKVAVEGAPYLRKVDLEMYGSYQQLLGALEEMFTCFTIFHNEKGTKLVDRVNGTEYVATYEDRDGDWMLVGDVPWKMFAESCKRVRLVKRSEAIDLAQRTSSEECTSFSLR